MSGPDRIWAWSWPDRPCMGQWSSVQEIVGKGVEYVRRDQIAALPEVQALIAGAYEAAIGAVHDECWTDGDGGPATDTLLAEQATTSLAIRAIRALTPADAIAARDAMIAEAVAKEREACVAECQHRAAMHEGDSWHVLMREAELCGAAIRKRGENKP